MKTPVVGLLHPGQMGTAVAAAVRSHAGPVLWAEADRSRETAKRAEWADLLAVQTVADVARRSDVVISLCPPHAALDVAQQVADAGGVDLYLDANAVAPSTVVRIAALLGAEYVVDGAVIGPPPWKPDKAVLHLAGARSAEAAALFDAGPLATRIVGPKVGLASAVKACFTLQSKAAHTMWAVLAAAAAEYGVDAEVRAELQRNGVDLDAEMTLLADRVTPSAWRFAGEMDEAGRTFADAGLPDGISQAAAEVFRRVAAVLPRDSPATGADWIQAVRRTEG
ncbi:MAG: DUF1932 domain-containing protein [Jatrophihabitans sp.]